MKRSQSIAAAAWVCAALCAGLSVRLAGTVAAQELSAAADVPANVAPHPPPAQPVPYSHKTHLALGIACAACHANPDTARERGLPVADTCMGCHSTIATDTAGVRALTAAAASETPIAWARVYEVLPGVTWSHAPHLTAGVECTTCHGEVAESEAMSMTTAVTAMAVCIACHETHGADASCATCHAWPGE